MQFNIHPTGLKRLDLILSLEKPLNGRVSEGEMGRDSFYEMQQQYLV